MAEADSVIGWDIGGAHLKGALWRGGALQDVAQWPCPVWQGLDRLHAALEQALQRWPQAPMAAHALTMTAEMTDLFQDRADGVQQLAAALQGRLAGPLAVYAGPQPGSGQACWLGPADAAAHWPRVASANWLATAQHAAAVVGQGLLVDIGSTTTDLVLLQDGGVDTRSRSDRDRLASGELVYQGVVRTPLCALGPSITLQGQVLGVMNEWFATSADVYRLTGELDPDHDQQPSADNAGKDPDATRQRLARMLGCDARDATADDWLACARAWRAVQLARLAGPLQALLTAHGRTLDDPRASVVVAGAGGFLVPELLQQLHGGRPPRCRLLDYGRDIARAGAQAGWAGVCAPSVAVAALRAAALR